MSSDQIEKAFPYKPPSDAIRNNFRHIFNIRDPLAERMSKRLFDIFFGTSLFVLTLPILLILKLAYLIEGMILPSHRGPMLYYYYAVSAGKIIKKYKLRLIKMECIDPDGARRHDWAAYSKEWAPDARTFMGVFVKKFYLDEIPQFFSVVKGDISIVGPRPLSVVHYERDLNQGNVTRKLLKGGLLGLGHINKGTDEMGNPQYEYQYADSYINLTALELIRLDFWIIYRGIVLMAKGGGH